MTDRHVRTRSTHQVFRDVRRDVIQGFALQFPAGLPGQTPGLLGPADEAGSPEFSESHRLWRTDSQRGRGTSSPRGVWAACGEWCIVATREGPPATRGVRPGPPLDALRCSRRPGRTVTPTPPHHLRRPGHRLFCTLTGSSRFPALWTRLYP